MDVHDCVVVQENEVSALCNRRPLIAPFREITVVFIEDRAHTAHILFQKTRRFICGCVVDDNHLEGNGGLHPCKGGEARGGVADFVEGDDDERSQWPARSRQVQHPVVGRIVFFAETFHGRALRCIGD